MTIPARTISKKDEEQSKHGRGRLSIISAMGKCKEDSINIIPPAASGMMEDGAERYNTGIALEKRPGD
jgi:hypothetical protein